ncbi:hypothetical protein GGH96_003718 [Coemansia sp. RSA 1972]|nr:hypothetical protein GGH96_003718 [Coemansia sp. RSA 1972]
MSDLELQEIPLNASDWKYSGEGNMKIVFTYTGPDPSLHNWLLQLNKGESSSTLAVQLERRRDARTFSAFVVGPLIGPQYILEQRLVRAPREFLASLSERTQERPAHRTHAHIDVDQGVGVLVPNMLAVRSVTVELKPKWGFLPQSSEIAPANSVKHRVCRYCMHQHLKHQTPSQLCPLDLYSTTPNRVERALDALAESPQNNMRVFIDGVVTDTTNVQWRELKRVLTHVLLKERILVQLQRLQRELDPRDIEGVFPVYERAMECGELSANEPSIGDWLETVKGLQTQVERSDKQVVLEYLLSMVLKDVSVMIMIEQWPVDGDVPEYKIAVVDTEPKKLAKMARYRDLSQEIVDNYLKLHPHPSSQKQCYE